MRLQLKYQTELQSTECLRLDDMLPRLLSCLTDDFVLVVGRKLQFLRV